MADEWERRVYPGEPIINTKDLMTPAEHKAMEMITDLFNHMSKNVVGLNPRARRADMPELAHHIHDLQRMIMSQAACRAFPDRYRLLGEIGSWNDDSEKESNETDVESGT